MGNVQIPRWLFDALCKYHITDTENRKNYEVAIKDGLFEKAEKMLERIEFEQKLKGKVLMENIDIMAEKRPNSYNWQGWQKLYDEYVAKIEATGARVTYAKQKYGYLCLEVDCKGIANTEKIHRLIDEAEKKSLCICEICGSQENVGEVNTDDWIKTLCVQCKEEN